MRTPLEQACVEGGVSCITSGIDPGWANDALPLLLGELAVDSAVCLLGKAVRHRRVLAGSAGEIPAVQQLVAERDAQSGAPSRTSSSSS